MYIDISYIYQMCSIFFQKKSNMNDIYLKKMTMREKHTVTHTCAAINSFCFASIVAAVRLLMASNNSASLSTGP
jgi:hypothetical protein